jgi:hypothetical protein
MFLRTSVNEVIHCALDTMYAKAPYTVLQRAVHIHSRYCRHMVVMSVSMAWTSTGRGRIWPLQVSSRTPVRSTHRNRHSMVRSSPWAVIWDR